MQQAETKTKKKLPPGAGWLIGYFATLAAAAGLVYFWRVVFAPMPGAAALPLTLFVAGVASLLYFTLFLVCRIKDSSLCLRAAVLVFALGLVYCFATAPLQAPDESRHFLRAYSISSGHFTYDGKEQFPNDVNLLVEEFAPAYNHNMRNQSLPMASGALAHYQSVLASGEKAATKAAAPIMFQLVTFLPQALFMALARLFGFSALGLM
ncbi:MAG: hypothetical protein AB7V55_06875, partial [Oscillospiraceae bacterium]